MCARQAKLVSRGFVREIGVSREIQGIAISAASDSFFYRPTPARRLPMTCPPWIRSNTEREWGQNVSGVKSCFLTFLESQGAMGHPRGQVLQCSTRSYGSQAPPEDGSLQLADDEAPSDAETRVERAAEGSNPPGSTGIAHRQTSSGLLHPGHSDTHLHVAEKADRAFSFGSESLRVSGFQKVPVTCPVVSRAPDWESERTPESGCAWASVLAGCSESHPPAPNGTYPQGSPTDSFPRLERGGDPSGLATLTPMSAACLRTSACQPRQELAPSSGRPLNSSERYRWPESRGSPAVGSLGFSGRPLPECGL
jgi:hypothetical protein